MPDKTNYLEIVEELLNKWTPLHRVADILSDYSEKCTEKKNRFYINVSNELKRHSEFVCLLSKKAYEAQITSNVDGVILYYNANATEWEPLFIVGPPNTDVHSYGVYFEELMSWGDRESKKQKYRNYCDQIREDEKIDIEIRGSIYKNKGNLACIVFNKHIGDHVKEGDAIGFIQNFDFVPGGRDYLEKQRFLLRHCTKMIREIEWEMKNDKKKSLPILNAEDSNTLTNAEMKRQNFKQIWDKEKLKYYGPLMFKLTELKIENVNCVSVKNGRYFWANNIGKGSKTYLAAFFYECQDANLLDGRKYSGSIPVIRSVLENTFNITSTSDPYDTIRESKSHDDYRAPFREVIKKILNEVK